MVLLQDCWELGVAAAADCLVASLVTRCGKMLPAAAAAAVYFRMGAAGHDGVCQAVVLAEQAVRGRRAGEGRCPFRFSKLCGHMAGGCTAVMPSACGPAPPDRG